MKTKIKNIGIILLVFATWLVFCLFIYLLYTKLHYINIKHLIQSVASTTLLLLMVLWLGKELRNVYKELFK